VAKASVRLAATKKGMVEALQLVAHGSSEELLRALVGKLSFSIGGKWQPGALWFNVFVDGLCRSTSPGAPRRQQEAGLLAR